MGECSTPRRKASRENIPVTRKEIAAKDREIEAMREFYDTVLETMATMKDLQNNILDSMQEGVFTTNRKGRITSFNKRAERITGFGVAEIMGKPVSDILRAPEFAARDSLEGMIRKGPMYCETTVSRHTGEPISAILCLSPLKNVRGTVTGVVAVFQDVTEIKGLRAQMIRSEKLALMGRLAASIAHEINNPIGGILTYANLVSRKIDRLRVELLEKNEIRRQLAVIEREVERCGKIVRNLLDFARPVTPSMTSVSLESVLEQSMALLGDTLRHKNIRVRKEISPSVPTAMADSGQMQQVFMNLIINACDAMSSGGELKIEITPEEDFVVVRVSDTGCGIPEDRLKEIFDPFFTTKADKEERGLGLGLSIVQSIIKEHGGYTDVKSEVGKGTTFIIGLPRE